MRKKTARIMTGIGIGIAVGAMTGAIGGSMSNKRMISSSKTMRTVENMLDGIQSMMK